MKKATRIWDTPPPEERLQQLLQDNPKIFTRVTQNDIARYLGITAVALSQPKSKTLQVS